MAMGSTAPTAAEAKGMQTTEVVLIRTLKDLNLALRMMLVYLMTFENGAHAQAFEVFLEEDWKPYSERLTFNETELEDVREPYLKLACHLSRLMGRYFRDRLMGRDVSLPRYNEVCTIIDNRNWAKLQNAIPVRYCRMIPGWQPAEASGFFHEGLSHPPASAPMPAASARRTPALASAPAPAMATVPATATNTSVPNPELNVDWNARWQGDGRRISTLNIQGKAPSTTRQGRRMQICLGYNFQGRCFSNCRKRATHFDAANPMTDAERAALEALSLEMGTNSMNAHQNQSE
jgi:hypothetical protein